MADSQTPWSGRASPPATVWGQTGGSSFLGFITRDDGFQELVGGNTNAMTFSVRSDDDFLSLDTQASLIPIVGKKIVRRADGFISFIDL